MEMKHDEILFPFPLKLPRNDRKKIIVDKGSHRDF